MKLPSNPIFRSYLKTTVASLGLAPAALLFAFLCVTRLPRILGPALAVLSALAALGVGVVACACVVVLVRYRRTSRGGQDLFLELNHSRDPDVIAVTTGARRSRLRRWLARRLLGHDLLVGDQVEVRPWAEIRATLDERGCLENLPFMPEMLAMCGTQAHVFRCAHRLFDHRKTRRMRHMDGAVLLVRSVCDGSRHGGCDARCYTIWKAAWLRRIGPDDHKPIVSTPPGHRDSADLPPLLQAGAAGPRYTCQLTELSAASRPVDELSPLNFLCPLVSGNVTPAAFAVAWLTLLFNEVQQWRKGVDYPTFDEPAAQPGECPATQLTPGERVVVRSSAEIRSTLNDQWQHRGLWFEPDMLKHCGHVYSVNAEIRRVIDIVSGEMLTMKTPAYTLRDVTFSGERQLFNAQQEPLYWRAVWLSRPSQEGTS